MSHKVRVFISWAGELGERLGQAIANWIRDTLQFVEPIFTPGHIEKGTKWLSEISTQLENCDCGIICLTKGNLDSPWILFEAGALSKKPSSRVCTLLFDVAKAEVTFPLAMFQATQFGKEDFRKLIVAINKAGGEFSLEESGFARTFDKWWPDLEKRVNGILGEDRNSNIVVIHHETDHLSGIGTVRSERALLEEMLELTRSYIRQQETVEAIMKTYMAVIRDSLERSVQENLLDATRTLHTEILTTLLNCEERLRSDILSSVSTSSSTSTTSTVPPKDPEGE